MPEVAYNEVQDALAGRTTVPSVPTSLSAVDSQRLGESSQLKYTPPKPEVSLGERVSEDVQKPFIEMQHTVGSGMYWLGDHMKDNSSFGGLGDRIARSGIVLRERSEKNLKENFQNFTPNLLDNVVGAVPSLAAFLGVSALAGTATAVGGTALLVGAGIGAEEFAKFKAQGRSTLESDALAAAIGIPTAGVMAAGFGLASKLTAPWLTKVLGDTIGKIVSDRVVPGAAAFGAQALTQGSLELATGATPYEGKDSLIQLMANTANAVVLGGVLGGATALPYVFKQHAAIVEGFQKLGLSPKDAKESADAMLAQASHVTMDQIEKHIDITPEEHGRIETIPKQTAGKSVPNVLDRKGMPLETFYEPVNQEPMTQEQVAAQAQKNLYVKLDPIDLEIKSDKFGAVDPVKTTRDLREKYMGSLDQQLLRGGHLREDMLEAAVGEEHVPFWNAHYNRETLQKVLDNPREALISKMKELHQRFNSDEPFVLDEEHLGRSLAELENYRADIQRALEPSSGVTAAVSMAKQYYDEAGQVASSLGTIREVRENYVANRLYKPDEKPVRVAGTGGLKQFSSHSLERIYNDPIEAIAGGKRFATTNLADLVAVHNQELAVVNHARQLADAMNNMEAPLAKWVNQGSLPKDWVPVGNLKKDTAFVDKSGQAHISRRILAAPKGIAKGLEPLVDPDWFRLKIPGVATLQQLQAYTKTGILGLSVFHDITFATQLAASPGGVETLVNLPKAVVDKTMSTPQWREKELLAVQHNLTTSMTHSVQDILSKLDISSNPIDQAVKQVLKVPVLKQLSEISDAHTKFLFGPYQRWAKVETWAKESANWEAAHPNASEEALRQARIEIAHTTNAEFGGRNWEVLGVNKTVQSLLRTFLLAPDWVLSMVSATKYAAQGMVGQGGAAGVQARGTLFKAVAGGIAIGDLINYISTGHHMWDNKKGHQMEVEIAPDVYFSPVRGAPGELVKLVSYMHDSGSLKGAQRYAEGKSAPMLSSAITAITGLNYYGSDIWKGDNAISKSINGMWAVLSVNMPIPIGVGSAFNYASREDQKSPVGWGAVMTGAGRFSKPSSTTTQTQIRDNVVNAYRNGNTEYIEHLVEKGDLSQAQADEYKERSLKSDLEIKTEHMRIEKMISLYKSSKPDARREMKDLLAQKFDRFLDSKASANEKTRIKKLYNNLDK